ncbi:uncharacterized protein BXZ73DRAFT_92612 [Epithele typhae]|uniref:uncharacterized protein n=1 Tax=Epithele typhae TaxID=378194 RepID=UPI0020087FBB|nr:uncharacterized protein BXZ73DRAFT_92612 [Epithele typhae]KAH9915447.1 hypothetical protein BXZ73DRAFT_92612 [Epithele typhae]
MAASSVAFPSARSARSSVDTSTYSLSHHQTAAEVCELFYGDSPPAWAAVERFYDPNATYENPCLTATSRETISDVHLLSRYLSQLDVPKPGAVLCTLFRLSADHRWRDAWFRGVRMWNEINEISECDSFDGHKRTMVEHTLHVLVLPGLHLQTHQPPTSDVHALSDSVLALSPSERHLGAGYQHPELSFWPPSPFHLKLPIITKLSFNDADKITHHRDFWDVKDLLGLVPGMTLFQWISGRLAAQSIRTIVRASRALFGGTPAPRDEEAGQRSSRVGFTSTRSLSDLS